MNDEHKSGHLRLRLWDVTVSIWVVVIAWLGDLAQWGIENAVPVLKTNTTQGIIWGGLAFGLCTLVIRFVRNNAAGDKGDAVFPLTPPPALLPKQEGK